MVGSEQPEITSGESQLSQPSRISPYFPQMEVVWTEFDYRYYQLEDSTMFWSGLDMCSDALGLILGVWSPLQIHQILGVQANNYFCTIFYVQLCFSLLINLAVFLSKRFNKAIFYCSLIKGVLFLIPCGMIIWNLSVIHDPNHHHDLGHDLFTGNEQPHPQENVISIHDPIWGLVFCFLALFIFIKGMSLKAQSSFYTFLLSSYRKGDLTRDKLTSMGRNRRRHEFRRQFLEPWPSPRSRSRPGDIDVENTLEDFYIRKTALLNHNLLMKKVTTPPQILTGRGVTISNKKKADNWTEHFYIVKKDDKKLRKDKVWILSDPSKDKFLTREVAFPLEGGKYTIYDGQIAL